MNNSHSQITRRQFLGASLAGSALLGLQGVQAMPFAKAASESGRKPNFIIIYCDDLGYGDLSCYGSPTIRTPRVDRMAQEGVKFTDFYSVAAVCTPSRAGLMTGCYPIRVNLPSVLGNKSEIGINSDEITIAEVLKTRGYATAIIGKWHLGHLPKFLPTRHGFDYYFGIPYSNDMPTKGPNGSGVPLYRNETVIEHPAVQETLTKRYTQEAIDFITKNKDRPFFLYLPHTFPHVPLSVTEDRKGKSPRGLYGDVVEELDWSTGEILDALQKLGLDEDTLVVFTSDNGPWLSMKENGGSAGPLREGKANTWEGGFREPCVMRWPGRIPAGSVCTEVAATMDLYPTLARLAGAETPTDRIVDGRNIWPLMASKEGAQSPHEAFFYYWKDELHAVRSGKWKLVLPHKKPRTEIDVPLCLYDLRADIGEKNDVSASYPRVVERLKAMAERMRQDLGDAVTGAPGKNRRPAGKA